MHLEAPSQEYYINDLHIRTERKTIYIYTDVFMIMQTSWTILDCFLLSLHPYMHWVLQRATCFYRNIFTDLKRSIGWEVQQQKESKGCQLITCITLQGTNISPWCLTYLKMIFLFFQVVYVNSLEGRYIQLSYLSFSNWPLTKVSFTFQCNFSPRHGARGEMTFVFKFRAAAKVRIFSEWYQGNHVVGSVFAVFL